MQRFFRIHLSTGIAMMLVAGALLGINLRWRAHAVHDIQIYTRGFPWVLAVESNVDALSDTYFSSKKLPNGVNDSTVFSDPRFMQLYRADELQSKFERKMKGNRFWRNMAGNIGVALAITLLIACLVEWRLRKRAA